MFREAKPKDELEDMLTLKEVRDVLGVSYGIILGHIRCDFLRAYKVTGEPISKNEVGDKTFGIRVKPSDLREYLALTLIK